MFFPDFYLNQVFLFDLDFYLFDTVFLIVWHGKRRNNYEVNATSMNDVRKCKAHFPVEENCNVEFEIIVDVLSIIETF